MTVMFKIASGETPPIDAATSSENIINIVNKCCAISPSSRPPVEDLLNDAFLVDSNTNMSITSLYDEVLTLISSTDDDNAADKDADGAIDIGVNSKERSGDELEDSDEQPLVTVYPSFISRRNDTITTSSTTIDGSLQTSKVSPSRGKEKKSSSSSTVKYRSKSVIDEYNDNISSSNECSSSIYTEDALQYTASASSLEVLHQLFTLLF
jgi:serine/threonine protein kinase